MASINELCKIAVEEIEHALAVGIVDLSSGLLLGVHHTIPYFTPHFLDAVAAAAVDMFRGQSISAVEAQYSESQDGSTNTLQEAYLGTTKTYHFMSIVPGKKNALAILITNKKVSLDEAWHSLRVITPEFAPSCP